MKKYEIKLKNDEVFYVEAEFFQLFGSEKEIVIFMDRSDTDSNEAKFVRIFREWKSISLKDKNDT